MIQIVSNGAPIVYFDILVTIQRQFINIQYRDTSKVENMVRIGVPTRGYQTAKTAIASLYFQCYNPISYSGHPRGSTKYRLAKMWGGGGCTEDRSYLALCVFLVANRATGWAGAQNWMRHSHNVTEMVGREGGHQLHDDLATCCSGTYPGGKMATDPGRGVSCPDQNELRPPDPGGVV